MLLSECTSCQKKGTREGVHRAKHQTLASPHRTYEPQELLTWLDEEELELDPELWLRLLRSLPLPLPELEEEDERPRRLFLLRLRDRDRLLDLGLGRLSLRDVR